VAQSKRIDECRIELELLHARLSIRMSRFVPILFHHSN
jgi:hypothetical protein